MPGVAATVDRIKDEALRNLPDDPSTDHCPLYDGVVEVTEWLAMIAVDVRMPMEMRINSATMLAKIAPTEALREKFAEFLAANS